MRASTEIVVADVFHHFGLRPILRDVSFELGTGRTLAIIGPNGTGKTTLLDIIAGLCSPCEGTVTIGGLTRRRSVDEELAIRQRTVFLPDQCWFPKSMTGRQYLLGIAGLYAVPVRRAFDHADRLLDVFQLSRQGDADISSYSTGQKKKLGLCGALITDAAILLLDEPFSGGLDPAGITAMKQILRHLTARHDRTVILTTPVPEFVEEVADFVLILAEGTVLKCDSVENIKRDCQASTLDEALRTLIFPETEDDLRSYFENEVST